MKQISLFLAALLSQITVMSQNKFPKPNWTLKTDETQVTIGISKNKPVIYEIRNTNNALNWIKTPQVILFPEKVLINNKICELNWKYLAAEIIKESGTKLILKYYTLNPKLELNSIWEALPGVGPIENTVIILNNSGNTVAFYNNDIISANIKFVSDSAITLWRFNKGRQFGYNSAPVDSTVIYKDVLKSNTTVRYFLLNERFKNVPEYINTYLPYQIYDINSKHGLYIGYSWSFGIFINETKENPLEVSYKAYLCDTALLTKENGKRLVVPSVFFGTYMGDTDDGSNKMKRWFWNYKITKSLKENLNEPLIEYCIPGNEKQLIEYYEKYHVAEWGAELGKIDIEWLDGVPMDWTQWPKGNTKRYSYWEPDPLKWPDGMTAGKIVHSKNQKLSLYMCDTYEWADIATQEGRDKQKQGLISRYDKGWYDYWRSDFIIEKTNNYLSHEGFLEILDYMIKERPDFRYEHCAGGGLLKDFSTLQRISVFTNEDSGKPDNHRKSYYSCSYMINPVQIKADLGMNMTKDGKFKNDLYVSDYSIKLEIMDSPQWINYVLRNGFTGANMATNWGNYTPNQIIGVREHWPLYKNKQRPILRGEKVGDYPADVYHILPMPDGKNWDGIQYFNTSINKGSVLLFKPSKDAPESKVIKLKGLNKKEIYSITFQDRPELNTKMTGEELMNKGIDVKNMKGNFASEIIWIN